jgi:hypothetical protein
MRENKISKEEQQKIKSVAKSAEEFRKSELSKKEQNFNTVKYALELGLKKGAYTNLEEMSAIINSFNSLK